MPSPGFWAQGGKDKSGVDKVILNLLLRDIYPGVEKSGSLDAIEPYVQDWPSLLIISCIVV